MFSKPICLICSNELGVLYEISNVFRGSNIRWRGRSFAASIVSDTPKAKKGRKRVPNDERKAMVESFVNKYRAMNLGNFPTASDARKEVGGSYYVIRKILQEMEYKSKIPAMNTNSETSLARERVKENESSSEVKGISSSQMTLSGRTDKDSETLAVPGVDTGYSSSKHFEVKEEPQKSILIENKLPEEVKKPTGTGGDSEYVALRSHMLEDEVKEVLQSWPEKLQDEVKKKTPSVDVVDFHGPQPKTEQHQWLPELENSARDLCKRQTGEELRKKPSLWGNLKSLADGIISVWRKQ